MLKKRKPEFDFHGKRRRGPPIMDDHAKVLSPRFHLKAADITGARRLSRENNPPRFALGLFVFPPMMIGLSSWYWKEME